MPPLKSKTPPVEADPVRQVEPATAKKKQRDDVIISINLPRHLVRTLRQAAVQRADVTAASHKDNRGGRPSVSALILEILQRHEDEIEELARTPKPSDQ